MSKTHLIVASEGDLEINLKYVTKLALAPGDKKTLSISFPSTSMMNIFMSNLFRSFIVNRVPTNNNLDIVLNIPDDGEDNSYG